jgi:hypothetical protein
MTSSGNYERWTYAPLRFVVWVLALVYLGRLQYNNTLWDLRQLTVAHVVVRTLSIAITLGFVYWNAFVIPPRLRSIIWATIAFLVGFVFVWKTIIDVGAEYHESADPLERRRHPDASVDHLDLGRRVAGKRLGDIADDD